MEKPDFIKDLNHAYHLLKEHVRFTAVVENNWLTVAERCDERGAKIVGGKYFCTHKGSKLRGFSPCDHKHCPYLHGGIAEWI